MSSEGSRLQFGTRTPIRRTCDKPLPIHTSAVAGTSAGLRLAGGVGRRIRPHAWLRLTFREDRGGRCDGFRPARTAPVSPPGQAVSAAQATRAARDRLQAIRASSTLPTKSW